MRRPTASNEPGYCSPSASEFIPIMVYLLYARLNFFGGKQLRVSLGVKSGNALRMNSRCTWRHREGLQNVHHTSSSRALSPSRLCGSLTAGVHGCPRWVAPIKHYPESRAHQEGEPVRSHDTIAA